MIRGSHTATAGDKTVRADSAKLARFKILKNRRESHVLALSQLSYPPWTRYPSIRNPDRFKLRYRWPQYAQWETETDSSVFGAWLAFTRTLQQRVNLRLIAYV
jgi:hypothetical protein